MDGLDALIDTFDSAPAPPHDPDARLREYRFVPKVRPVAGMRPEHRVLLASGELRSRRRRDYGYRIFICPRADESGQAVFGVVELDSEIFGSSSLRETKAFAALDEALAYANERLARHLANDWELVADSGETELLRADVERAWRRLTS